MVMCWLNIILVINSIFDCHLYKKLIADGDKA